MGTIVTIVFLPLNFDDNFEGFPSYTPITPVDDPKRTNVLLPSATPMLIFSRRRFSPLALVYQNCPPSVPKKRGPLSTAPFVTDADVAVRSRTSSVN